MGMEIRQIVYVDTIDYLQGSQTYRPFEIVLAITGHNAEDRSTGRLDSVIQSQNWVILRQDK
jgi:hypothetical protein